MGLEASWCLTRHWFVKNPDDCLLHWTAFMFLFFSFRTTNGWHSNFTVSFRSIEFMKQLKRILFSILESTLYAIDDNIKYALSMLRKKSGKKFSWTLNWVFSIDIFLYFSANINLINTQKFSNVYCIYYLGHVSKYKEMCFDGKSDITHSAYECYFSS